MRNENGKPRRYQIEKGGKGIGKERLNHYYYLSSLHRSGYYEQAGAERDKGEERKVKRMKERKNI